MEHPGWRLSWDWPGDEVIWNILGAESTEQGNCPAALRGKNLPHCCDKQPVIIDLLPSAPFNSQVANCCKGGVLSSFTQDPGKSGAAFQMSIGDPSLTSGNNIIMPGNFTLGLPGYTCGDPVEVPPSKFVEDDGRRRTQAIGKFFGIYILIFLNYGCLFQRIIFFTVKWLWPERNLSFSFFGAWLIFGS